MMIALVRNREAAQRKFADVLEAQNVRVIQADLRDYESLKVQYSPALSLPTHHALI